MTSFSENGPFMDWLFALLGRGCYSSTIKVARYLSWNFWINCLRVKILFAGTEKFTSQICSGSQQLYQQIQGWIGSYCKMKGDCLNVATQEALAGYLENGRCWFWLETCTGIWESYLWISWAMAGWGLVSSKRLRSILCLCLTPGQRIALFLPKMKPRR